MVYDTGFVFAEKQSRSFSWCYKTIPVISIYKRLFRFLWEHRIVCMTKMIDDFLYRFPKNSGKRKK